MTSNQHDPHEKGQTRSTKRLTNRCEDVSRSDSEKLSSSRECPLQFEDMNVELLVIVDQHATVNLYLCFVLTARHNGEVKLVSSGGKVLAVERNASA